MITTTHAYGDAGYLIKDKESKKKICAVQGSKCWYQRSRLLVQRACCREGRNDLNVVCTTKSNTAPSPTSYPLWRKRFDEWLRR